MKKISVFFSNALNRRIKEDPTFHGSAGFRAAFALPHRLMAHLVHHDVDGILLSSPVARYFLDRSSDGLWLQDAFKTTARVEVEIHCEDLRTSDIFRGCVVVYIKLYRRGSKTHHFQIHTCFDIVTGKDHGWFGGSVVEHLTYVHPLNPLRTSD